MGHNWSTQSWKINDNWTSCFSIWSCSGVNKRGSFTWGGYLTIFARKMAWQEKGDGPDKVVKTINNKIRRLQSQNPNISISFFNVLMPLRFDSEKGCPEGHEYLSRFVQHGWLIESLVLLSPDEKHYHYHRFGAPIKYIHNSTKDFEISQMVGKVRNHFGWA